MTETNKPTPGVQERAQARFAEFLEAKKKHGSTAFALIDGHRTTIELLPADPLPEALDWESFIDHMVMTRNQRRRVEKSRPAPSKFRQKIETIAANIPAPAQTNKPKPIPGSELKITKAVRKRIAQLAKPLPPLQGKATRAVKYERPGEAFIAGGHPEYTVVKNDKTIKRPIRKDTSYLDADPTMEPTKWDHRDKMEKCYRAGGWETVDKYIAEVHELAGTQPATEAPAVPEAIMINVRKDGTTATVASVDYIQAKTADLQASGYSSVTTDEVAASVAKALIGAPAVTVIDKFVADDIVVEGGAV
jgi:hypothetical protein